MAGLKAAVYKDLKLFLKGTGIITLFLPFLLLGFMYMGIRNMSAESLIHPYKVAVRDEDHTAMSNVIIQQAEQIEFFREVTPVDDSVTDEELIENGYGAVFTIPKDYFYQVWTMSQEPIQITLNADMPMESAAFKAVLTSIMDIMKTEQASSIAVYEYVYGDVSSVKQKMYAECAKLLVMDALGRKGVFDIRQAVTDISLAALRRFMAACMILLVFFQAISTMKTLPDEKRLGVMPRFQAAGRSSSLFILSKFIFLFFLTMPALILFGLILGFSVSWNISQMQIFGYILLCLVTILTCGAAALLLSALCPASASVMRYGNLILIISLFFSGTFIAVSSLPSILQPLHTLAVPTYIFRGLECIHRKTGILTILKELMPMIIMAAASFAAVKLIAQKTFELNSQRTHKENAPAKGDLGFFTKLKNISFMKLFHMNGRTAGALMIILSVIFAAAASSGNKAASSIRIAVIDKDKTFESQLLQDSLAHEESITIVSMTESEALHAILDESIEGAVTISDSYTDYLHSESKKNSVIAYDSASSSFSSEGIREILAGRVTAEKILAKVPGRIEEMTGETLSEEKKTEIRNTIISMYDTLPPLSELTYVNGAESAEPFSPSVHSYAALIILFIILSASSWCALKDHKNVTVRMYSLPKGKLLGICSDLLALFMTGFITAGIFMITRRMNASVLPVYILYIILTALIAYLLTAMSASEGMIDSISPFISLLICVIGGCFIDLSSAISIFKTFSMISPAGLLVHACAGSMKALAVMIFESLVFASLIAYLKIS